MFCSNHILLDFVVYVLLFLYFYLQALILYPNIYYRATKLKPRQTTGLFVISLSCSRFTVDASVDLILSVSKFEYVIEFLFY